MSGRVVNYSKHEIRIESGTCDVVLRDAVRVRVRSLTAAANLHIFDPRAREGMRNISGRVVEPHQGVPVMCRIPGNQNGIKRQDEYLTGRDTLHAALAVSTNDGQMWIWEGMLPMPRLIR
jgi:hypothetical protein